MLSPYKIKIPQIRNFDEAKKYLTFSPKNNDSNYSSYIKEQNIYNHFKMRYKNSRTIDFHNKYINKRNNNIFRHCINTSQNIFPDKLNSNTIIYNNNISKSKPMIKINTNRNILLTSLFNPQSHIPKSNKQTPKKEKNKINLRYRNNIECSKSVENSFKNIYTNTEGKDVVKLENYMKDKFYEDIEKKMNIKLMDRNFCHDKSMKDKIIKLNKIGLFWGSVFEYCNPLITVKKYKCIKDQLKNNKNIDTDETYAENYKNKMNNKMKPILYTHNLVNRIRRREKISEILFKNDVNNNLSIKNK
jgi:hypothetical protein